MENGGGMVLHMKELAALGFYRTTVLWGVGLGRGLTQVPYVVL